MDDRVDRIDRLLGELEAEGDERALEAIRALLELYGEGLERIVERVGPQVAEDELVAQLLIVHGLHPEDVETRVSRALDEVRPYLTSHGGGVELVGVHDGVVRLALEGTCNGCPSSARTLELAVEEAIHRAAPEVEAVETAGAVAPEPVGLSLPMAGGGGVADPGGPWAVAGGLPQLQGGGTLVRAVAGRDVLFAGLDGAVYAYAPRCPGCGSALDGAVLIGEGLSCPGCGRTYDVRRAGRCLDAPDLHLDPVPLLVGEAGIVKVAVA